MSDLFTTDVDGIRVSIPGDPVPWARMGGGKNVRQFTPPKQAEWKERAKTAAIRAMGDAPPMEGPMRLHLVVVFASKKPPPVLAPRRWHLFTPDLDNLNKIVGDAFSKIVYRDDKQVCAYGRQEKVWASDGEEPGVHVFIERIAEPPQED